MRTKKSMIFALLAVLTMATVSGFGATAGNAADTAPEIVVFAAASTTNAVTEIGRMFEARQLGRITLSFASSSTLAKQIEKGAPADVYISANKKWMDYLEEKHLLTDGSRFDLLGNRIVLIVPADSPVTKIDVLPGFPLVDHLGADGRLAIGDPDHVPAGTYGRKALENLGSWKPLEDRLAPMKDVRAALVLVERGEAPVGLVYATDAAISAKVRVVGTFPADAHPPIVYPVAAVIDGKTPEAMKFLSFLKSSEAREVFEKYGFHVE